MKSIAIGSYMFIRGSTPLSLWPHILCKSGGCFIKREHEETPNEPEEKRITHPYVATYRIVNAPEAHEYTTYHDELSGQDKIFVYPGTISKRMVLTRLHKDQTISENKRDRQITEDHTYENNKKTKKSH